ncbi:MAG: fimbrillin family protein [Bacteroidales bacterium]
MKKQLLGLAACALILSSCSQNQEIENYEQMNREEVRLAPYVNKTKASVMGDVALQGTGFKVFAVQHAVDATDYSGSVFMDQLKESWNTDKWMHDGKYYWPETEALSFFMVAPYDANLNIAQPAAAGAMTLPVTINNNVADQIDILAASVLNKTKVTNASGKVNFTFKHILSKIGFAAKVKDGENLKFKITGISFTYGADMVKDGTYTFGPEENVGTITTGATLHGAETSSVIDIKTAEGTIIETHDYVSINADNAYLMLMPQNVTGDLMTMTLNYQVAVAGNAYDTAGKTATIAIPAMEYKQGLAYTYNLILSSESGDDGNLLEVTFGTVGVENWADDTAQPGETPVE